MLENANSPSHHIQYSTPPTLAQPDLSLFLPIAPDANPRLHLSPPPPFLPTTTVPCVGPLVVRPPTGFAAACDQSVSSSPSRTHAVAAVKPKKGKKSYSAS